MLEKSKRRRKGATAENVPCRNCARKDRALARLTNSANGKPPKQLYFDEKWVALRWGIAVKTLQTMRYSGAGPKWQRPFGRSVRYRLRDIVEFERQQAKPTPSNDE